MRGFSFSANVVAALLLSTLGVVLSTVLQPWIGHADASRVMLLLLSLGYLAFLLHQCRPRYGLSLVICSWLLCAMLLLLFNPPLLLWLAMLAGALWLLRSALRYQHLYQVGLDALLNVFAGACACSVLLFTHSLWLSLWSYFLCLAFSAAIPARPAPHPITEPASQTYDDALASAQSALRRLQKNTSQRPS